MFVEPLLACESVVNSLSLLLPSYRVSYRDPNAPVESGHRGGHQSRPSVSLDKGIEVLVSFHSKQHDIVLNEEFLLSYFSQFGRVADCVVKSFSRNTVNLQKKNGAKQGGYGFVVFTDASAAGHVITQFQQRVDVTVVVQQRDKVGEPLPDMTGRSIVVTIQCHLSHASEEAMQRRQRENMPQMPASPAMPSAMTLNPGANPPQTMMNTPTNHHSPMTVPSLFLPMNVSGGYYVNQGPQPNNMNANSAMGYGKMQPQFVQVLSTSPPQAPTPIMGQMPSPLQQAQMSPDMVPQYAPQTFAPAPHDVNAVYRSHFAPFPNVQAFPQSSYQPQPWTTAPPMPYPMVTPRLQPPAMSFPPPMQPGLNYHMAMSPSQTPSQQPPFVPPPFVIAAQGANGPNGPSGLSYSPQMMHAASPPQHGTLPQYTQQGQARPPQQHH